MNMEKNALDLLAQLKEIIEEQELTIAKQAERIKQLESENSLLQQSLVNTQDKRQAERIKQLESENSHLQQSLDDTQDKRLHQESDPDNKILTPSTTPCTQDQGRRDERSSLSSIVRRSSSFHKKHLEEQDVRTRTESYELSSDLFDKQIEVLRNRYGGTENSEKAARIIQEAYRRYRMRLNFRKIRKSKNRRLTLENKIHISDEGESQNSNVEVVELVLEQSFGDDTKDSRSHGAPDEQENCHSLKNEHDDEEETFDHLFDSNNGNINENQPLDTGSIDEQQPVTEKPLDTTKQIDTDTLIEISVPAVVRDADSIRRRRKNRHGYETVLPGKVNALGNKDKDENDIGRKHGETTDVSLPGNSQPSYADMEFSSRQHTWQRVGSNISLASNENEADEESLRSSDTASIASGQSEFSNNVMSETYQRRSTLSTRGSWHIDPKNDVMRKRLYRIGLNLFNKKPERGIEFLVENNFIARTAPAVATFLLNRKGLSRQMVGEYLGNSQKRFNQDTLDAVCELMDFSGMEIDEALRDFQRQVKVQGEAQKVDRLVEAFSQRYCTCNPKFAESLKNPDAIFILAFAIIMLNTDLHSPNMKHEKRMSEDDFVRNLRGVDGGDDLNEMMLRNTYNRIREDELKTGDDHVTQVLNVEKNIMGKKPVLAVPHRRLVCYCRLYQVTDPAKPQKIGLHQRAVFLFNDLLLITKVLHRKRSGTTYGYKLSLPLQGMNVLLFETTYYLFGIRLINAMDNKVLVTFNAPNEHDRNKFVTDLRESVNEVQQMENYRIGAELERAQLPVDGRNSLTRDSKILSASMHNLNEMKGSHNSAPQLGSDRPASMYTVQSDSANKNNNNFRTGESKTRPVSLMDKSSNTRLKKADQSVRSFFKVAKKANVSPQSPTLMNDKLQSNGKPQIMLTLSEV